MNDRNVSEAGVLTELLDSLPLGIVVLDPRGNVVIYNRTEEGLARRAREAVLGRPFFVDVAPCMNVRQLAGEFQKKIGREHLEVDVEFSFPFPFMDEPRDVRVKLRDFEVAGVPHGFLMIEDISAHRAADRMKETLQNLLVHDLKNPLAALVSNLDFLHQASELRDNQDALDAITDSLRAASRLQGMLLNLLDITRLETGAFPLTRKPTGLGDLLERVAEDNRAQAKDHGARIVVDVPQAVTVWLDDSVLRRALDNLVENGVRHAKTVTLSGTLSEGVITLEVRDDGSGIPQAMRDTIFEKYAQAGSSNASGHNRGLGLTFVRLAARAHGGDAVVTSGDTGGSRFQLRFPDLGERGAAATPRIETTRGFPPRS